jgi:hypothetical protein
MALWIDVGTVKKQLATFFSENKQELTQFGNTVNQTFEAFVFASLVNWYRDNGWSVSFHHPKEQDPKIVRLKFSTRGRPDNYTYAVCEKQDSQVQIRHQIRVATNHHRIYQSPPANVVLDVAVIGDQDLSRHKSEDYVDNSSLFTFGEAKHMSAFAELIASFIGLVHELKPEVLLPIRSYPNSVDKRDHPSPFLYVSGYLLPTAKGLEQTIIDRGYDIDIYDHDSGKMFGVTLPVVPKPVSTPF